MMHNIIEAMLELVILSSIVIIAVLLIKLLFAKRLHMVIISFMWIIVLARLVIPYTFNSPIDLNGMFEANDKALSNDEGEGIATNYVPEVASSENYSPNYSLTGNTDTFNNNAEETDNADSTAAEKPTVDTAPVTTAKTKSLQSIIVDIMKTNEFLAVVITLWMMGAWITLIINLSAIYDFNRKVKKCKEVNDVSVYQSLEKARNKLGVSKNIKVYQCAFIDTPVTCGLLSSKILLPVGFYKAIDSNKMHLILMHELSHIKNRDILKNYLWLFARVVYWFNPLVAIAYNKYLEDIEYLSDERVIRCLDGQSPLEYTQSLLDAVKLSNTQIQVPVALSFCKSKSKLRKRVEKMLKPQKKSKLIGTLTIMLCAVIFVTCFTTACIKQDDIAEINGENDTTAADANIDNDTFTEDEENNENPYAKDPASKTAYEVALDSSSSDKNIKHNPIGSKEEAMAIAEKFNISNANSFELVGYYGDEVAPTYVLRANDDSSTLYTIYEYNGELKDITTFMYIQEEMGEELSLEEIKTKTKEYADYFYPNTVLTITSCVKDNKKYDVEGQLYDKEDRTRRHFTAQIKADGGMFSLKAEYIGMDFLDISEDVKNRILSYALTDSTELSINQFDRFYDDMKIYFMLDDGETFVTVLQSDYSFVDFHTMVGYTEDECTISDEDAMGYTNEYAKRYFPDMISLEMESFERHDYYCYGEGKLTDGRGTMDFHIKLNSDGSLHNIGITPLVDIDSIDKIEAKDAQVMATNEVLTEWDFVDKARLEITELSNKKDDNGEYYWFKFKYIAQNPTVFNYSFTAQVGVDVYTGTCRNVRIELIEDGLDLMTEEEAIQKAREHLSKEFDMDPDDFVLTEIHLTPFGILEYQVNFECEGRSYGVGMFADTGEVDGISWGE